MRTQLRLAIQTLLILACGLVFVSADQNLRLRLRQTGSGGGGSCALPNYPDATCTGVPAGTSLTPSGSITVSTNGAIIDALDVTGCITVTANNVTIKRTRVTCSSPGNNAIYTGDANTGLVVQDSELYCTVQLCTTLTWRNYTATRVNFHGGENVVWAETNVTIQDSYCHNPYPWFLAQSSHSDCFQVPESGANVTIQHNRVYGEWVSQSPENFGNSAWTAGGLNGGASNILITQNLVAGGGYTVQCGYNTGHSNFRVTNNRFSTVFVSTIGGYGPVDNCNANSSITWTGNVYHESGLPVN